MAALVCALLFFSAASGALPMGRCRSYVARLEAGLPLDGRQQRRYLRDKFYSFPKSSMLCMELDPELHKTGKTMLKGIQLHQRLSDVAQTSSSSGLVVAHRALKSCNISKSEHQASRATLHNADEAKHSIVARAAAPNEGVSGCVVGASSGSKVKLSRKSEVGIAASSQDQVSRKKSGRPWADIEVGDDRNLDVLTFPPLRGGAVAVATADDLPVIAESLSPAALRASSGSKRLNLEAPEFFPVVSCVGTEWPPLIGSQLDNMLAFTLMQLQDVATRLEAVELFEPRIASLESAKKEVPCADSCSGLTNDGLHEALDTKMLKFVAAVAGLEGRIGDLEADNFLRNAVGGSSNGDIDSAHVDVGAEALGLGDALSRLGLSEGRLDSLEASVTALPGVCVSHIMERLPHAICPIVQTALEKPLKDGITDVAEACKVSQVELRQEVGALSNGVVKASAAIDSLLSIEACVKEQRSTIATFSADLSALRKDVEGIGRGSNRDERSSGCGAAVASDIASSVDEKVKGNKCSSSFADNLKRAGAGKLLGRGATTRQKGCSCERVADGELVKLYGLTKVPELNGRLGAVINYDAKTNRYEVQVEDLGNKKIQLVNFECIANVASPKVCDWCASGLADLDKISSGTSC